MAGQKAMEWPARGLGPFCITERLVKVAVAGSNSHSSLEATSSPDAWSRVSPSSKSRRFCAVTSEAYMRAAGRLGSLPSSRCVQVALFGSQSQRSASSRFVSRSSPPASTAMPRPGSYAMA